MSTNNFDRIAQLKEDYAITRGQLMGAHNSARDIVGAVRSRLEADREQTAARTTQLEAQAADPERSETVRRVAEMELTRLRSRTVAATAEETAAFEEQLAICETAKKDAVKIQQQMRTALSEVDKEIKAIRAAVLGDQQIGLSDTWADGCRRDFALLSEEAKQ